MNTIDKLNKLADLQSALDVITMRYTELRKSVIPQEIQDKLADIDAEQRQATEAASTGITALSDEIKADVIRDGKSVKGEHLQAVYSQPRVTWDNKGLDGFMVAHPEIVKFRKVGSPSVSIRTIK